MLDVHPPPFPDVFMIRQSSLRTPASIGDELRLEQEVEELPRRAAAVDEAEDALYGEGKRDDELPGELAVSDHCWFPWGPPDADAPPLNCVGLSPV